MYQHAIGARRVTRPAKSVPEHHHFLVDTAIAIVTAMLLADCAYNNGTDDDFNFAMNLTPYYANCLEEDFGC